MGAILDTAHHPLSRPMIHPTLMHHMYPSLQARNIHAAQLHDTTHSNTPHILITQPHDIPHSNAAHIPQSFCVISIALYTLVITYIPFHTISANRGGNLLLDSFYGLLIISLSERKGGNICRFPPKTVGRISGLKDSADENFKTSFLKW